MHDPSLVRCHQSARHTDGDVESLVEGQRPGGEDLPQRPPLDELLSDVMSPLLLVDLVDGDDIGVIQCRGRARLLPEPVQPLPVGGRILRQDLQRHPAVQPQILGEMNLTHPSGSDSPQDPVV
jgi:hypothetical protein